MAAALTIWRWGRQNAAQLTRGRHLGSFETWAEWVRDPLLTLGCADVVDRIVDAKASDPARKRIAEMFDAWHDHHGALSCAAKELHEDVRLLVDPQGRGRQFVATALDKLTGTRVAGFVLDQLKPSGKWGTTVYLLRVTDPDAVATRRKAKRDAEACVRETDTVRN